MKNGWKKEKVNTGQKGYKDRPFPSLLFVIIVFSVGIVCFFGTKKKGYFIDELYSFGLSNGAHTDIEDYDIYGHRIEMAGENPFVSYLTVDAGEGFSYAQVYKNQIADVHPPFYYFLLHTISSFFPPGYFSGWQGILLNLFFLVFILYFLYRITQEMFQNKNLSLAVAGVYGISAAAIGMSLYIRMYALLTALSLGYFYVHLLLYRYGPRRRILFTGAALLYLGLMTQYHFVLFAFITSGFYSLYLWKKKEFTYWLGYAALMFSVLAAAYLSFPFMRTQLAGNQNSYVRDLLETGERGWLQKLAVQLISFISFVNYSFFGGRVFLFVGGSLLLFGVVVLFYRKFSVKKKKNDSSIRIFSLGDRYFFLLLLFLFCNMISLGIFSWVPALRYYYHIFPLLSATGVYFFYRTGQLFVGDLRWNRLFWCLVGVFYVGCCFYGGIRSLDGDIYHGKNKASFQAIPYLYPGEDTLLSALSGAEECGILLVTDYKNASVTQELYRLLYGDVVYITNVEKLGDILSEASLPEEIFLVLDVGEGLWGSGYTKERLTPILEKTGFFFANGGNSIYGSELNEWYRLGK